MSVAPSSRPRRCVLPVFSKLAGTKTLKEVRAAVARCRPDEFHQPNVVDMPVVREQIDVIPDSRLKGLAADRTAFETTMTSRDGRMGFVAAIYQRRGAILSAVYGGSFEEILPFAQVIARRLGAITPEAAGDRHA